MSAGQSFIMSAYVTAMANNSPADKWGSDAIKCAFVTSSTQPVAQGST